MLTGILVLFIVATSVFGAFVLNNFIPVSLLNIVSSKCKKYYVFAENKLM